MKGKYLIISTLGFLVILVITYFFWLSPGRGCKETEQEKPLKLKSEVSSSSPNSAASPLPTSPSFTGEDEFEAFEELLEELLAEESSGEVGKGEEQQVATSKKEDIIPKPSQSSILERLEAFKRSSKEYQELAAQARILIRQRNRLSRETVELTSKYVPALHKFVAIPPVPTEERKRFEEQKDRFPPEVVHRIQGLWRIAEERKEEREELGAYLKELDRRKAQVKEELERVNEQLNRVNASIIELLHRHGLPGTRIELRNVTR